MKFNDADKQYLNGLLSGLDDLSDGAWGQVCQDMIANDPRFKRRDPFDVWIAWCSANAKPAPEGSGK